MAKKDKTLEERVDEAAKAGRITYASQDQIDDYTYIADEFLQAMFDLNPDEVMISDESRLSDFAGCCIPEDVEDSMSLQEMYDIGRNITVEKIQATYGITVDPYAMLIDVFEEIRVLRSKRVN